MKCCFTVVSIACVLVLGSSAGGQIIPCLQGFNGGIMYGIEGSKNAPFSGVVKSSFEQKLADGNTIHGVTRTHQARDASGRTMTEMAQGCVRGEDGQMHERLSVNVNDPVARTNMNWQVDADDQPKVVIVFHQPDPPPRRERTPEEIARQQKLMELSRTRQALDRKEYKTEDLGTKQINGVTARGSRSTRTIPAGEEGNDQPLVVINETWRSKDLGLMVMAISDDPRRGRTTTEYEELNLGEPDGALFVPPEGYKVQEQPQTGMIGTVM
jgi:hypothetical protein